MVTIVPKPAKKIPSWQPLLFYFALGLLAAALLSWFVLIYFENQASVALENLEKKIEEAGSDEDKRTKDEVFAAKEKIEDFSILFAEHQRSSNFFEFLEEITHPRVWFTGLELSPADLRVKLSGVAPSFPIAEQQLYIFKEHNLIKETKLTAISLGGRGGALFSVELSLFSEIFKLKEEDIVSEDEEDEEEEIISEEDLP